MGTLATPTLPRRRAGWFADRSLKTKFAILALVILLALADRLTDARALVFQVDTRATSQGLLDELDAIPLTGDSAAAVADLQDGFGDDTDAITAFTTSAIADQAGMRASWEDIQEANDLSDGLVDAAGVDLLLRPGDVRAVRRGLLGRG